MMQLVHSHLITDAPRPKKAVKSRYEQNAEDWNNENWNYATSGSLGKRLEALEKAKPGTIARIKKETQFI